MSTERRLLISLLIVTLLLIGCERQSHTGAGVGAVVGAGAGQVVGRDTKSTLIGAGIGAGAGYLIGRYMEKKDDDEPGQVTEIQEPTEVEQNPDDFVKIDYTNSDATVTTVALRRSEGGYVGPEGEFYQQLPTSQQLSERYGY